MPRTLLSSDRLALTAAHLHPTLARTSRRPCTRGAALSKPGREKTASQVQLPPSLSPLLDDRMMPREDMGRERPASSNPLPKIVKVPGVEKDVSRCGYAPASDILLRNPSPAGGWGVVGVPTGKPATPMPKGARVRVRRRGVEAMGLWRTRFACVMLMVRGARPVKSLLTTRGIAAARQPFEMPLTSAYRSRIDWIPPPSGHAGQMGWDRIARGGPHSAGRPRSCEVRLPCRSARPVCPDARGPCLAASQSVSW